MQYSGNTLISSEISPFWFNMLLRVAKHAARPFRPMDVVKVGDYDECLCIGVHVENTSEIGTFKIISHDWDEEAKRWRMRFKLV